MLNEIPLSVLLQKLSELNDENQFVCKVYSDLHNSTSTPNHCFNALLEDFNTLYQNTFDMMWCREEASKFGCKTREFKHLLEGLIEQVSSKISEMCQAEKIITTTTIKSDFCPFPQDTFVCYSPLRLDADREVIFEGHIYRVIESRLEENEYYAIYCSLLERKT